MRSSNRDTGFDDLSDELLVAIFSKLDPKNLHVASFVSQKFNRVARDQSLLNLPNLTKEPSLSMQDKQAADHLLNQFSKTISRLFNFNKSPSKEALLVQDIKDILNIEKSVKKTNSHHNVSNKNKIDKLDNFLGFPLSVEAYPQAYKNNVFKDRAIKHDFSTYPFSFYIGKIHKSEITALNEWGKDPYQKIGSECSLSLNKVLLILFRLINEVRNIEASISNAKKPQDKGKLENLLANRKEALETYLNNLSDERLSMVLQKIDQQLCDAGLRKDDVSVRLNNRFKNLKEYVKSALENKPKLSK